MTRIIFTQIVVALVSSIAFAQPHVDHDKGLIAAQIQSQTLKIADLDDRQFDTLQTLINLFDNDPVVRREALLTVDQNWSDSYVPVFYELFRLADDQATLYKLTEILKAHAPHYDPRFYAGIRQLWDKPDVTGEVYANFKAHIYEYIDPKFKGYFQDRADMANIRLDEVLWGGVVQDGIPPLRNPEMLEPYEADYLADTDVVFGVNINGDVRAYPQRILAWHEFFTDEIGGHTIAGVYCTLCGTVIMYDATVNGKFHKLGTSGFLYRSNKLMYDEETQSLWNTVLGEPVIGPLFDQGIKMDVFPVETTTWGQWKKDHPETKVLSLETGHRRDYGEGVAYNAYYATDELMFPVPKLDERLNNKARVFIPRIAGFAADPIAFSVDYLRAKGLAQASIGDQDVLVVTDSSGASQGYAVEGIMFDKYKKGVLLDKNGDEWTVTDESISHQSGKSFDRIPAHEMFWFSWFNTFPETRLVSR